MTKIQRIRRVISWYVFLGIANNDTELATLMGYTKSSFSQILNEKVPISDKFIDRLCSLDVNINKVWINEEVGTMTTDRGGKSNTIEDGLREIIALQKEIIEKLKSEVADLNFKIQYREDSKAATIVFPEKDMELKISH